MKEQFTAPLEKTRYDRNMGTMTKAEQELLKTKSVCIVGCGGLGGCIIENLTRMGIGRITAVDCDVFDVTNLNRQVLSNEKNIGYPKAEEAMRQMGEINSETRVIPVKAYFDEENGRKILKGHDVVIDAADNISTRLDLERVCEAEGIPLVHGAIAGWTGQAAVILPGDRLLQTIYPLGDSDRGVETETGNPSFTPAVVAGVQTAECLKLLTGRDGILRNRMLVVDLLGQEYEIIDFFEDGA